MASAVRHWFSKGDLVEQWIKGGTIVLAVAAGIEAIFAWRLHRPLLTENFWGTYVSAAVAFGYPWKSRP